MLQKRGIYTSFIIHSICFIACAAKSPPRRPSSSRHSLTMLQVARASVEMVLGLSAVCVIQRLRAERESVTLVLVLLARAAKILRAR